MSLILNIESATEICSIVISRGIEILAIKEIMGNKHAEQITLLIEECVADSGIELKDLDAIALSNGPGSYTSLRIGTSTAKGLCYALDIPLIAVDTLQSLAWAAFKQVEDEEALYCPMIDARRMEVYTTLYKFSKEKKDLDIVEPMESKIIDSDSYSEYFAKNKNIYFCGNGSVKCENKISNSNSFFLPIECSARYLYILSYQAYKQKSFVNIAYHTPLYLKAPNITVSKHRL